ncbi:hypothetical protein BpHYR1_014124 [Brachionus plicatilis]|uniref:Uncharacterized protein n=1 Tax=Brachionus plicatilis TaxID=10195 RepID=A0A3M7SDJ6_BRAPC|nr:hypothetical protein BpHYR1_014124 [Brachionus plicatilis]
MLDVIYLISMCALKLKFPFTKIKEKIKKTLYSLIL